MLARMPRPRLAALALLLACGPQPQPAPDAIAKTPPADAIAKPPPTDAITTPPTAPVTTPDASLAEPPAPDLHEPVQPTSPPAPTNPVFEVAAYRDGWLDLHLLGDQVFVNGGGGLAHADKRGRLVHVEYGLSGQAEPWLGLHGWQVHALGGLWPTNAWLVTEYSMARASSPPHVHHRVGGVWQQLPNKDGALYWYYEHVLTWHSGQVLGLRAYSSDPAFGYSDLEDMPRRTRKKIEDQLARARRGFDLLGDTPTPTTMILDPNIRRAVEVAIAPTGELFLLGAEKNEDARRVQQWGLTGDAAVAGTSTPLAKNTRCTSLAVRSAAEAYIGCTREVRDDNAPHILRWDGAAWTDTPAPPIGHEVSSLSVAPTGELYAVVRVIPKPEHSDELWRRLRPDAAWERVALPELSFPDLAATAYIEGNYPDLFRPMKPDPEAAARTWTPSPSKVLAVAADDIWVVAATDLHRDEIGDEDTRREVVLRTKTTGEPLAMLHDEDLYLEAMDWRTAKAWQPDACLLAGATFATLRTLPAGAPRDQPEPALEAFVRDNPTLLPRVLEIYEVHRRGRRTVGLFVDLPDQPAADALLTALERAAPGEPHTLECRRPRPRRKFDKATGLAISPAAR
jgi:hypothetical protein